MSFMLLSFFGSGAFTPYLQLYFQERGLTPVEIGTLTGIGPALSVFMPLFWGLMGDSSRQVRMLLAVTTVCAAAAFMGVSVASTLTMMMVLVILFNAFSLAGGPLSTAIVLREAERLRTGYGPLRMWGSVGYAIGILAAGRLVTTFGTASIFPAYAIPVVLALIPLIWMNEGALSPGGGANFRRLRSVVANRTLFSIMLITFVWRITSAGYYTFYTIYISDMGASASMISAAWFLALVGEVTVLRFSNRLALRVGVAGLLVLGLLGSGVRWLAYAMVPSAGWTLMFQVLHGLTFGATTTAAVLAVDRVFPPELRSTGQGLLSMVMWGLGGLLGSLAVGVIFRDLGPRVMFGLSSAGALGAGLLVLALLRWEGSGLASLQRAKP